MSHTFEQLVDLTKYCPVCGKELEVHPFGYNKVCFVHGDFKIRVVKGMLQLVFEPMPNAKAV